jgi:NhaP-type Na+/H+ or K+/H+ antiporter
MFARLTARAIWTAVAIAMAFFGIGLLGHALAAALMATLGPVGGYAVAGLVLLVPPLIWAVILRLSRPRKPPQPANNDLTRILLGAVAKETPWIAIVGAGLAAAANMFLNRNKPSK